MTRRDELPSPLLDVGAAAEFLGLSRETVLRMVRRREHEEHPIPVLLVGRSYRFAPEDLVAWARRGADLDGARMRARVLSYEHERQARRAAR